MIHCALARDSRNSLWIDGRATWTTEKSTTSRNAAEMTTARISRACDAARVSACDVVGCCSSRVSCFMTSCLNRGGLAASPHPDSPGRGAKVLADASARRAAGAILTGRGWGPSHRVPRSRPRQEFLETVPGLPRSEFHSGLDHFVEVPDGLVLGDSRQLRLALQVFEDRGLQDHVPRRAFELERRDEALRRHNLAVLPAKRVFIAIRIAAHVPPAPALAHIHSFDRGRLAAEPPPLRDELRIRVRLKNAVPRGVEHAGHDHLARAPIDDERGPGGLLSQGGRELLEALAPALPRSRATRPCRESGVPQRHLRLPADVLERDGHEHLQGIVLAHAVVRRGDDLAVFIREVVLPDELLHRNDLAVVAPGPEVLPVRRPHAVDDLAADAQVDLAGRDRVALRAKPAFDPLGFCPRLPHLLSRRVVDARNYEVGRLPLSLRLFLRLRWHLTSSWCSGTWTSCVPLRGARPTGRSGPPRGRGTA